MEDTEAFVLDGSITMAWYFKDERNEDADAVRDGMDRRRAFVPSLWPLEVANTLVMGERRNRSTPAQAEAWIGFLRALPITIDAETSERAWGETLNLARDHKLSVYDAAYLELAIRLRIPIATLDARLKVAATAVGVTILSAS